THTGLYTTGAQSRTITNEIKARIAAKRPTVVVPPIYPARAFPTHPHTSTSSPQPILQGLLLLHHKLFRTERPVVVTATILSHTSKNSKGERRKAHAVSM
ncbi:unnamed protein product, partial [Ectocarpus sp. 4 AP-2014]